MLELHFFNVGDGDAALLTEHRPDGDFTVLVDAGRAFVEPKQGSLRKEAISFLRAMGVTHLDWMLLSHLHIDHVGDAARILANVPTKRLGVLTLPPEDAGWIAPSFISVDKPTNGLCSMLNIYAELLDTARRCGTEIVPLTAGTIDLTDALSMQTILPKSDVIERQRTVFDALYRGESVSYEDCFRVSKERNVSSLMHRFTYAGRSVLFGGDRYGFDWADEPIGRCDVLKVPHHGDPKSITPLAAMRVHPRLAVISCQNDAKAKKERPSGDVIALLQAVCEDVLCTENPELPTLPAATYNAVRVRIDPDGTLMWGVY